MRRTTVDAEKVDPEHARSDLAGETPPHPDAEEMESALREGGPLPDTPVAGEHRHLAEQPPRPAPARGDRPKPQDPRARPGTDSHTGPRDPRARPGPARDATYAVPAPIGPGDTPNVTGSDEEQPHLAAKPSAGRQPGEERDPA